MRVAEPVADLDSRFSSEGATATEWSEARARLAAAEIFWISTVRPDGRPPVTPLISVWPDDALYFCTGPSERKARNLAHNPHCILTTGCNTIDQSLDVVVEGDAVQVTDDAKLSRIADLYESKYSREWRFRVRDGVFVHEDGEGVALVFEVAPKKAFGFGKGSEFSQTRGRFHTEPA